MCMQGTITRRKEARPPGRSTRMTVVLHVAHVVSPLWSRGRKSDQEVGASLVMFCHEIGQHFGVRRTFQSEHPSLRNLGRGQGIQKNTQVSDGSCFGFGNVEGVAVETPSPGLRVFLGEVLE